jgi:hypothetical protein
MIDDSDLNKIAEHIEQQRKARLKKENKELAILMAGIVLGIFIVVFVAVSAIDNAKDRISENSRADQEIMKIQNLNCAELRTFTPVHANANYVILELLQRCY